MEREWISKKNFSANRSELMQVMQPLGTKELSSQIQDT